MKHKKFATPGMIARYKDYNLTVDNQAIRDIMARYNVAFRRMNEQVLNKWIPILNYNIYRLRRK